MEEMVQLVCDEHLVAVQLELTRAGSRAVLSIEPQRFPEKGIELRLSLTAAEALSGAVSGVVAEFRRQREYATANASAERLESAADDLTDALNAWETKSDE